MDYQIEILRDKHSVLSSRQVAARAETSDTILSAVSSARYSSSASATCSPPDADTVAERTMPEEEAESGALASRSHAASSTAHSSSTSASFVLTSRPPTDSTRPRSDPNSSSNLMRLLK